MYLTFLVLNDCLSNPKIDHKANVTFRCCFYSYLEQHSYKEGTASPQVKAVLPRAQHVVSNDDGSQMRPPHILTSQSSFYWPALRTSLLSVLFSPSSFLFCFPLYHSITHVPKCPQAASPQQKARNQWKGGGGCLYVNVDRRRQLVWILSVLSKTNTRLVQHNVSNHLFTIK